MEKRDMDGRKRGSLAWIELCLMIVLACVLGLIAMPSIRAALEANRQASCQANLKQLWRVFAMYSNESRGELWPPVSPVPGNWVPDIDVLYPEYGSDLNLFICPSHPDSKPHRFELRDTTEHPSAKPGDQHQDCLSSRYYVYTGFFMTDNYTAIAIHDTLLDGDWQSLREAELKPPSPAARTASYALIGPTNSRAVMWDRMAVDPSQIAHRPWGANVLYMDGHVEFRQYEADDPDPTFPVTYAAAELFGPLPTGLSPDCGP
ncbi:MAG: hypothetical protein GY851_22465 [bacterium]|nr:hypothetical protein [bacterium]